MFNKTEELKATEANPAQKQDKKEARDEGEKTIPLKYYSPYTDIMETKDSLKIIMDVPGVNKKGVSIQIKENVLNVDAHIDSSVYGEFEPVYSEYNLGNFNRKFSLNNRVDQEKIEANLVDGTLTLLLPKAEEAKPRRIEIN